MNTEIVEEAQVLELAPRPESAQRAVAVSDTSPVSMMMAALDRGATMEQFEKMMELQERHEANEARKDYNAAFAAFKAEAVRVLKNRKVDAGPLSGKSYAELHSVVDAVTPALSKHGLGASWRLSKDDKDWIEVTCTLKHSSGHSESVSMGGPPDAGGAKNAIQARASTVSYLERYTLKAICGIAEGGEDDDGGHTDRGADWRAKATEANTEEELRQTSKEGTAYFTGAKDVKGYAQFAKAVQTRGAALKAGVKNA